MESQLQFCCDQVLKLYKATRIGPLKTQKLKVNQKKKALISKRFKTIAGPHVQNPKFLNTSLILNESRIF